MLRLLLCNVKCLKYSYVTVNMYSLLCRKFDIEMQLYFMHVFVFKYSCFKMLKHVHFCEHVNIFNSKIVKKDIFRNNFQMARTLQKSTYQQHCVQNVFQNSYCSTKYKYAMQHLRVPK